MSKHLAKTKFRTILAVTAPLVAAAPLANAQTYTATVSSNALQTPGEFWPVALGTQPTVPLGPGGDVLQFVAGGQIVGYSDSDGTSDTLAWNGTTGTYAILNPTGLGLTYSFAYATNGSQQVGDGWGSGTPGGNPIALLWNGTAASVVNLNPTDLTGVSNSEAFGTNGTQQVGAGSGTATGGAYHALLWSGSAGSAVDLNPTTLGGITSSVAFGTDGTNQVGYGYTPGQANSDQALLWTGTAPSAVNLNPTTLTGVSQSVAVAVGGNQQVGYGYLTVNDNDETALLWTGTAASAVNLSAGLGLTQSYALATNGSQQVGFGQDSTTGIANALLWSGTAASMVNLSSFLPSADDFDSSAAYSIDASGDVFGLAWYDNEPFAVEWSPVPEPASLSILALGTAGLLTRRRRYYTPAGENPADF